MLYSYNQHVLAKHLYNWSFPSLRPSGHPSVGHIKLGTHLWGLDLFVLMQMQSLWRGTRLQLRRHWSSRQGMLSRLHWLMDGFFVLLKIQIILQWGTCKHLNWSKKGQKWQFTRLPFRQNWGETISGHNNKIRMEETDWLIKTLVN